MQSFGPYQLLDRIGSGGMGEIFLARLVREQGFEKYLVIKRILPHLSKAADFVAMFNNEARIAAQLNHQNICQIFDFGKVDNAYYIAMEYIRGHDLRSLIDRAGTVPAPLAFRIAVECLKALEYAHDFSDISGKPLGLIHRDVSPQNIMVTYTSGVKLMDFGLAKAAHLDSISSGMIKGNFGYMSPEQVSGRRVGPPSDLFNLGAVLYEMLTGKTLYSPSLPFEKLVSAVGKAEFVPLAKLGGSCPERLIGVVERALLADPKGRFESAGDMRREIESACVELSLPLHDETLGAFLEAHLGPAPTLEMPAPAFGGTVVSDNPIRRTSPTVPARLSDETVAPSHTEPAQRPRRRAGLWSGLALGVVAVAIVAGLWLTQREVPPAFSALATSGPILAVAPSKPPLKPPISETGSLEVSVTPASATVSVDGKLVSGPPYRLRLPAGPHEVAARAPGYQLHQRRVTIRAGTTLLYPVTLTKQAPILRTVTLSTTPAGATVTLDGVVLPGVTPITVQRQSGRYSVTLRLKGYHPQTQTVVVSEAATQRPHWTLARLSYQLRIGPRRFEFKPNRSSTTPTAWQQSGVTIVVRWSTTRAGARFTLDTRPFSRVSIGGFNGVTPVTRPQFVAIGRRRLVTLKSQGKTVRFVVQIATQ